MDMEYYLYCWIAPAKKMAFKCRFDRKQDTDMPQLASKLADEGWESPSPEWYALMSVVCCILVILGHMWYQRYQSRRVPADPGHSDPERGDLGHLTATPPRRPPRSMDDCFGPTHL